MAVSQFLREEHYFELAGRVDRFVEQMPAPRTDHELLMQVIARDRSPPQRTPPRAR
jgi:hypothetical protein